MMLVMAAFASGHESTVGGEATGEASKKRTYRRLDIPSARQHGAIPERLTSQGLESAEPVSAQGLESAEPVSAQGLESAEPLTIQGLESQGLESCASFLSPRDAVKSDEDKRNSIIAACSKYARGCSGRRVATALEEKRRVEELQRLPNFALFALCLTAIRQPGASRCMRANARDGDAERCGAFLQLQIANTSACSQPLVPPIYHAAGRDAHPPAAVRANAAANPHFTLNYRNDSSALEYVRARCGADAAAAYACLEAGAYRADVFRF